MRAPLLAISAFFALPLTLAQEKPALPGVAQAPAPPRPAVNFKTDVIRIQQAMVPRVLEVVREVFGRRSDGSQSLIATLDASNASIVLSGPADLVLEAAELVKTLDTAPVSLRQTRLVRLQHANASELAKLLNEAQQMQDVGRPGVVRAMIECDPRTAALLVVSDEAQYRALLPLIEQLDAAAARPAEAARPRSTRLEFATYSVDVPREKVAGVDAQTLGREARSVESLLSSLAKIGSSRLLWRFDQAIDLAKPFETTLGESAPYALGSTDKVGGRATQVNYQDAGCILALQGEWENPAAPTARFDLNLELRSFAPSAIELSAGYKAPLTLKAKQEFGGIAHSGRPMVLVSVSASEQGETAKVYVTRLVLTADTEASPT